MAASRKGSTPAYAGDHNHPTGRGFTQASAAASAPVAAARWWIAGRPDQRLPHRPESRTSGA